MVVPPSSISNTSLLYYKGEVISNPTMLLQYYLEEFYGLDLQIAGILAGCALFIFSVLVVILILYKSGSFEKLIEENKRAQEIQSHQNLLHNMMVMKKEEDNQNSSDIGIVSDRKSKEGMREKIGNSNTFLEIQKAINNVNNVLTIRKKPLLYEHLIEKSKTLPNKPSISKPQGKLDSDSNTNLQTLEGSMIRLFEYDPINKNNSTQKRLLVEVFNSLSGVACYGFPAYSALERIWRWFNGGPFTTPSELEVYLDTSHTMFSTSMNSLQQKSNELVENLPHSCNCTCYLIEEKVIGKAVGMLWITNNSPLNLTMSISHFCLTPAYRGSYIMAEAFYLILKEYFQQGYRRIEVSVDEENLIAKKCLLNYGFLKEGTLRKSKIIRQTNRDSCIFSMTNSDWKEQSLQYSRDFLLSKLVLQKFRTSARNGIVHNKIIDKAISTFIEKIDQEHFKEALMKVG